MKIFFDRNESYFREMILKIQTLQTEGLSDSEIQEEFGEEYDQNEVGRYSRIITAAQNEKETYWKSKNMFKLFVLVAFLVNSFSVSSHIINDGLFVQRTVFLSLAWIFSYFMAYYTSSRETGGIMYLIPILLVINPVFLDIVLRYDALLSDRNVWVILYFVLAMPYLSGLVFGISLFRELPYEFERVKRILFPPRHSIINPKVKPSAQMLLIMGLSYVPLLGIIPALSLGILGVRKERYELVGTAMGGLLCTLAIIILARMLAEQQ